MFPQASSYVSKAITSCSFDFVCYCISSLSLFQIIDTDLCYIKRIKMMKYFFDSNIFVYVVCPCRLFHSFGMKFPVISKKVEFDIYSLEDTTFLFVLSRKFSDQSNNAINVYKLIILRYDTYIYQVLFPLVLTETYSYFIALQKQPY